MGLKVDKSFEGYDEIGNQYNMSVEQNQHIQGSRKRKKSNKYEVRGPFYSRWHSVLYIWHTLRWLGLVTWYGQA